MMNLREVSENGVISIGGQLYKRRDHQGSVVNMELIYPVPEQQKIRKFPEATVVRPPSQKELQRYEQSQPQRVIQ
jgi:hypothetical protein